MPSLGKNLYSRYLRSKHARHPRAALIAQFLKFGIVGVSNTLLTLAVYTLLVKVLGMWYLAASAIGFTAGAVNGFLWNRSWTFRGHSGDGLTALRWMIVQSCGLLANLGLMYLFVDEAGLDKLLGQLPTLTVVTVLTFFANRTWTFRMHHVTVMGTEEEQGAAAFATQPSGR